MLYGFLVLCFMCASLEAREDDLQENQVPVRIYSFNGIYVELPMGRDASIRDLQMAIEAHYKYPAGSVRLYEKGSPASAQITEISVPISAIEARLEFSLDDPGNWFKRFRELSLVNGWHLPFDSKDPYDLGVYTYMSDAEFIEAYRRLCAQQEPLPDIRQDRRQGHLGRSLSLPQF